MEKQCQNLLNLIRAVLTDCSAEVQDLDVSSLLSFAQSQGVANLLYPAFKKLPEGLRPEAKVLRLCKGLTYAAASRDAIQEKELSSVLTAFHEARIPVLPLKGCVIKKLYPQPEYRYMTDADLLFPENKAQEIKGILEGMGFTALRYALDDTDFYLSPSGMNYELHRSLREEGTSPASRAFLSRLLDLAVPSGQGGYLQLPPEEHYVYILLHFVKHLSSGGAGLRSVMDVWICKNRWTFHRKKLDALLRENELTDFARTVERLADVWFLGVQEDALSRELGDYLISGALFGTEERRIETRMLRQTPDGGSFGYWRKRVFPPYRVMCSYFPAVKKVPLLLPFAWLYRVFRGVFCKRNQLAKERLIVVATDKTILQKRRELFLRCGLKLEQEKQQ